jgi:serine/threonine-protein kinase
MPDLPLIGDEFAGYRLLAVLGRGGMSTVYQAESPRLGTMIALKVMAPELAGDDVFRTRFLAESKVAAGLNHPNVVPILGSGSSDGLLYIAMRYIMGTDLRQLLKERRRLTPGTAVFLLSQAAGALDTAHDRGLVHRDVKPGNLLVEQASDDAGPDRVYLTDFGIALGAAERTGLTATGLGSPSSDYLAPEQIHGLPVLGPADQYSLGCALYECLTGRVPFERGMRDMNAAVSWAHEEHPIQPTALRPDLPRAVDQVFSRVLARRPGDRYPSCREFMAAAREALGSPGPRTDAGEHPPDPPYSPDPPCSAESRRPPADRPAEVAHDRPGVRGEARESIPGPVDWTGSDEEGALTPGGAGSPPSGRRPRAGRRRARRRGPSRTARWLVLSAAVGLALAAGAVALTRMTAAGTTKVTLSGNGAHASPVASASGNPARKPGGVSPSAGSSMNMGVESGTGDSGPDTLAGVLAAADNSVEGKGLLPFAKCDQYQQNASGQVICTAPVPGVAEVYYQNYSSLTALYNAYETEVAALDGGAFRQNTGHCGNSAESYAEFGWNQEEGHPHNFTVARMASGQVGQIFAAGRMACFATRTKHGVSQDLVWTIDNGPAMGVAIGNGSPMAVYQLWASLHHAVLFRGTEMCGTAGRMNARDIPTGNLKVLPVCPPGVQAVPASPPA